MPAGASGVCDAPCQERPGLGPDCGGGTLGSLDEERFGFSVGQCPASSQRGVGRWRAWTRSGSGSVLDSVLHPASGGWDTGEPGRGAVQVQRWTVSCIRPAGYREAGALLLKRRCRGHLCGLRAEVLAPGWDQPWACGACLW